MSHYDTLQVKQNASAEVIRAAYKTLMQRYHPDRNTADTEAAKLALEISVAYAILSDPAKRAAYDKTLTGNDSDYGISPRAPVTGTETDASSVDRSQLASENTKTSLGEGDRVWNPLLWVVLGVLGVGFMIWILQLSSKQVAEREAIQDAAVADHWAKQDLIRRQEDDAKRVEVEVQDRIRRTVALLPERLLIPMTENYGLQLSGKTLSIESVQIVVGKPESEKVLANIEANRPLLVRATAIRLALLPELELRTIHADSVIAGVIQKELNKSILGTRDGECEKVYSLAASGCRGVVEVILPKSFRIY